MFNHTSANYTCPICLGIQQLENKHTLLKKDDMVYQDEEVSAFINSFWIGKNEGHVIVVPNKHFENFYDLPSALGYHIFDLAKKVAVVMKETYICDGITLRQNNEPAGDQHAFHYHLHIFPRYENDNFNHELTKKSVLSKPEKRIAYAEKLKKYLEKDDHD
jgi:histidine triad (HIT) family protein